MRKKRVILLIALLSLIFTTGSVLARPLQQDSTWTASYWNNINFAGDAVVVRPESTISHNWGTGSPAAGIDADRFSAHWTRRLALTPGRYRFDVTADDGVRLFVDGQLLIDAWQVQPATTYSAETVIAEDSVFIELQYFENTGVASVDLSWTPVSSPSGVWQGEYFDNRTLSGNPAFIRDEATLDFDWGAGSPAVGILDADAFSARWSRIVDLPAGTYRFRMTVDDGGRLRVDNQLLIDAFIPQPATTYEAEITLSGGPVPLEMEYYEGGGVAEAALSWQLLPDLPPITPPSTNQTIIDTSSPAFVSGGPDDEWSAEPEGYNGSLRWTQNSRSATDTYNWGVWYPNLEAGVYQAAVYIPNRFSTTSQARYWVSHANGFDLTIVDQSVNGGQWVTLGTFEFDGTANDYISLADVTFEENQSRLVAYDAVRFTPIGEAQDQTQVSLSQAFASPGDTLEAYGSSFPPGQTIYLRVGIPNSEPFGQYDQGVVDADGTITLALVVPNTRPNGEQIIADELVILLITQDGTAGRASFDYVE